jgi:hypothetical protein
VTVTLNTSPNPNLSLPWGCDLGLASSGFHTGSSPNPHISVIFGIYARGLLLQTLTGCHWPLATMDNSALTNSSSSTDSVIQPARDIFSLDVAVHISHWVMDDLLTQIAHMYGWVESRPAMGSNIERLWQRMGVNTPLVSPTFAATFKMEVFQQRVLAARNLLPQALCTGPCSESFMCHVELRPANLGDHLVGIHCDMHLWRTTLGQLRERVQHHFPKRVADWPIVFKGCIQPGSLDSCALRDLCFLPRGTNVVHIRNHAESSSSDPSDDDSADDSSHWSHLD